MGEAVGQQPRKSRGRNILAAGILAFIVIATAVSLICASYSEYQAQMILNRQRDIQQALLEKSLDAIRVWRVELLNQARFISSSEMFRLFITDARELGAERLSSLAQPDALHSEDEALRMLAEQRSYMQDLLKDFVRRRMWNDARIVTTEGSDIVAPEFAPALTDLQKSLVEQATKSKRAEFGPIRQGEHGFYMDMSDPLFEVLGADEQKTVAVLLLSVPVDKPLSSFLAHSSGQEDVISSYIVDQNIHAPSLLMLHGNSLVNKELPAPVTETSLPFGLRQGANGGDVYSLGARPTLLDWLLVLETPASVLDGHIWARKWQIYALGALATIGLTLLVAFIYAMMTGKQYRQRAAELAALNNTIRQQKLVLDGVNNSLQAGLLLVDDKGFIQMANPAFRKLTGAKEENLKGVPLVETLPAEASIAIIGKMRNVIEENKPADLEISIPSASGQEQLYRVTLFPYKSEPGENSSSGSGCVATFQDITIFRANAKKAAQRQEALLTAMDRAMESVDPNLVGQSAKMSRISRLIADELEFTPAEKDTLRIASLLSQIGKLFVPKELLLKQGDLTPEERLEVGRAPEHADRILRDLHFDLPVRETVREMNERMDGSGPAGFGAHEISRPGRVLAVASAFIAMTSPRAWRKASMTPKDAMEQLYNDMRFDADVTGALSRLDKKIVLNALEIEPDKP